MYCLSVSHKTSNVVVRKKLAFPDEQKKTFLDELYYSENISECLILCTCNRTEVYFCGDESSVKTVETVLSDFSGIDFDELKKYICLFYGDRALFNLFTCCGINVACDNLAAKAEFLILNPCLARNKVACLVCTRLLL